MCVPNSPLFQRCRECDWPLFFQQKSIWMARFFWIPMWKAPFFSDILVYAHIFRSEIFRGCFEGCLSSWYYINWLWYLCNNQQKMGTKNQRAEGQYMNWSTFWMIKYMNGSVFSKARYMNGVGFEILARTPVPKLPLLPTAPATPHPTPPIPTPHEIKLFLAGVLVKESSSKCISDFQIFPVIKKILLIE